MKKVIAAVAASMIAGGLLASPAYAAAPAAEPGISAVKKSDYSKTKRNRYWRAVKRYDPLVKYVGKKTVIDLGVSTCDFLRAGGDIYDLSLMIVEVDAGIAEDSMIAAIAAAPVILCPDQGYKFE